MKRALPILGVAGLALLCISAPATASTNKLDICHDGKMISVNFNAAALNGHTGHSDDIIAPNEFVPAGLHWNPAQGYASCGVVVTPPVEEEPPAEEEPPVEEEPGEEQPPVDEEPGEEQPPVDEEPGGENPSVDDEEPTTEEEQPTVVIKTPVKLTPAVKTPAGQAAVPQGAVAQVPAAAVSRGTNQGFNAQTSVGGTADSTTWLAGLGVLLGAGAVVAVRRKSRTESPTAG